MIDRQMVPNPRNSRTMTAGIEKGEEGNGGEGRRRGRRLGRKRGSWRAEY
jgi:hypothetical protein